MVTYYLLLQIHHCTQKSGGKFYEKHHEYHLPHTFHMACIIPFVPPLRMSKARHVLFITGTTKQGGFFFNFFSLSFTASFTVSHLYHSHCCTYQIKSKETHTHTPRMGFSISRQTIELTLLLSFAFLSLVFAVFFEQNNETSMTDEADGGLYQTASIPFPGSDWIDQMAKHHPEDTITLADGRIFSSAYAAILDNDPLANPCRNFNAWVNSIFFSSRVATWFIHLLGDNAELAHYVLCYLRNFVGAMVVYYGTAGTFHYFCYVHPMSRQTFEEQKRTRPSWETIKGQIKLSQASMTVYTMLPVLDEFLIESGYTKVYFTVQEIGGWRNHIATMLFYFCCVEVCIYWMHRTLHTNKFLYKHIHLIHHLYNKAETLTPWASIAFHPLDGMLQASPYVCLLPFIPCHYLTHFSMLFFTAIWATYIHDAMDWNFGPIMGSKFHTVHHTHFIYNYGQIFQFCDWFWGTLRVPDGPTGIKNTSRRSKKLS